jgi:t-SNARE complex subunit (syntaxin)
MKKVHSAKKKKHLKWGICFMTIAVLSATVIMATILEGNRIKKENELLSYEVW